MDLDDEELKATRKMHGLDKAKNNESFNDKIIDDDEKIQNMQKICKEMGWIE